MTGKAIPGKDGENAVSETTGSVTALKPFDRYKRELRAMAELNETMDEGDEAGEISAEIIGKMLEADSLESAIAVQDEGPESGKNLVGVEHTVLSIEVVKSKRKSATGLGVYLRVKAIRIETGEELNYGVGAPNAVTVLILAMRQDRLPLDIVYYMRSTNSDNDVLLVKLVPPRAVKSEKSA